MTLREMQLCELDILIYIDEVCRKYDIRYFLDAGSLLGAVRHKGFIPWDDDIDITMTRYDFEKLLLAFQKEDSSRYSLCSIYSDPNWISPVPKVVDTKTRLTQPNLRGGVTWGVFVDVFIMDAIPLNPLKQRLLFSELNLLSKLWNACTFKRRGNWGKDCFAFIISLFSSSRFWAVRMSNLASKIKLDDNSMCGLLHCPDSKIIFKYKDVSDLVLHEFEGHQFYIPLKYDVYLRNMYGDYMKLPPREQRKSGHSHTGVEYI